MKKFRIYQLDEDNEKAMALLFKSYEEVETEFSLDLYKVVYEGEVEEQAEPDDIYCKFQSPEFDDYKGHSLSMSDIVYMDEKYYYCDDFGWKELDF